MLLDCADLRPHHVGMYVARLHTCIDHLREIRWQDAVRLGQPSMADGEMLKPEGAGRINRRGADAPPLRAAGVQVGHRFRQPHSTKSINLNGNLASV